MKNITVNSPFDEKVVGEAPVSDANAVEKILASAYQTFQDRSQWLSMSERKIILEKFLEIFASRKEDIIKTTVSEGGKPYMDSKIEVERAMQGVTVAIEHMSQMPGREIPMNVNAPSMHRMAYTFREPVGVVFSISAFNHPVNLIIHQVIPAIAVGCPVLIKPAPATPLSCFKLVSMLHEAGLPKTWCQAFMCSNEIAEKVVSDERISFLSFIGSAKVGWYLRSKLAPGARCALEHGGVAPVILEADADIDAALPLLLKGGFYHAGQVCVSVQRVFAHESIAEDVATRLADMAKQLKVGDPSDPKTEVGPLIRTQEVDRVDEWVQEAASMGGKVLSGGTKVSSTCYSPTVLLNPPADAKISRMEVFGPAVCVYAYKTRSEAIKQANSLPLSFQAAVFTGNIDAAMQAVRELEAVAVMVNDHTAFRVDWMPFGGRKQSGLGMGGIPYSMHDMTFEKMFVVKSPHL